MQETAEGKYDMCIVCDASPTYNIGCTDENPLIGNSSSNQVVVETLSAEIETTYNSYNKLSFETDQAAAHITRSNVKWDDSVSGNAAGTAGTVTYSYSVNPDSDNTQVTQAMIGFSEQAIKSIEAIANIDFVRIGTGTSGANAYSDAGDIDIEAIPSYGGGYASYSYYYGYGDNLSRFSNTTVAIGATAGFSDETDYGMTVSLHELSHAVGLSHPGNYNGSGATNYENQAEYFQDSRQYSVMSYWSEGKTGADFWAPAFTGSGTEWVGGYATNLMLHDIAALQRLYGANMDTRTGDTVYGFNSNTGDYSWELDSAADSIIAAVWDAGGIDTLDLSGFYENADVDLRQEAFSSFGGLKWNFSIAKGAVIENAIGGFGDDTLQGNSSNNDLRGLAGNDILIGDNGNDYLDGGAGIDQMFGGAGNDTIIFDAADNMSNVNGGAGFDTLWFEQTWDSVDLQASSFEQSVLHLKDTANELWDEITEYRDVDENLTSRLTINDNEGSQKSVFDAADTFNWSTHSRFVTGAGQLYQHTFDFDDERTLQIDFDIFGNETWLKQSSYNDVADNFSWSDYINLYNDAGQRYQQTMTFDNGRSLLINFDVTNFEVWSKQLTFTDINGSVAWDAYTNLYDDSGTRYQQTMNYDNGRVKRSDFDVTNNEEWSKQLTFQDTEDNAKWDNHSNLFDDDGQRYQQSMDFDDGRFLTIDFDVANQNEWSKRSTYDDANDSFVWENYTVVYNGSGQRYQQFMNYDDGRVAEINWDVSDSETWSRTVHIVDSDDNYEWLERFYEYSDSGVILDFVQVEDFV